LSDIRVLGLSNIGNGRMGPVHLHFSSNHSPELRGKNPRFSEAVFQSARILSKHDTQTVKEHARSYKPGYAPSIELLYVSNDDSHAFCMTILFHQTGPSVIFYSRSSHENIPTNLPLPRTLERLSVGYDNKYSYFTIPDVEKNCQN
jgi:hypothetical protein